MFSSRNKRMELLSSQVLSTATYKYNYIGNVVITQTMHIKLSVIKIHIVKLLLISFVISPPVSCNGGGVWFLTTLKVKGSIQSSASDLCLEVVGGKKYRDPVKRWCNHIIHGGGEIRGSSSVQATRSVSSRRPGAVSKILMVCHAGRKRCCKFLPMIYLSHCLALGRAAVLVRTYEIAPCHPPIEVNAIVLVRDTVEVHWWARLLPLPRYLKTRARVCLI